MRFLPLLVLVLTLGCATAQKTSGLSEQPETALLAQLPEGVEFDREWADPGRSYQPADPRARMCVASTRPITRGAGGFDLEDIDETAWDISEILVMMQSLSEHLPPAAAYVVGEQPWPPEDLEVDPSSPVRLWRGKPPIPALGDLPSGGTLLVADLGSPDALRLAEWWVGSSKKFAAAFTGHAKLDSAAGSLRFEGRLGLVPMGGGSFEGVQFTGGLEADATVTRRDGRIELDGHFFLAATGETLSVTASWKPRSGCEMLDNGLLSARASLGDHSLTILPAGEDCDGFVTWSMDGDLPEEIQLQPR